MSSVVANGIATNGKIEHDFLSDFANVNGDHFRLDESFINSYSGKKPKFGYNGLGEFVFYRTYSRLKDDGQKETFIEVLRRVVEGCYEIQRRHCRKIHIPWDYDKAQPSAQEMFQRMWAFKFLPPGRGLWCMGTNHMWRNGSAALNNCAFVSTEDLTLDPAEPFCFLMDMSMLGVGTGFDTRGRDTVRVKRPDRMKSTNYVIPDSREGWVESVRVLINSFTSQPHLGQVTFDYSKVRPAGTPIKGFGGFASGPGVLRDLHEMLRAFFEPRIGQILNSRDITDIMNMIGVAVVAGNVRRTAEIAFGDVDDIAYASMKNPIWGLTEREAKAFGAVTDILYERDQNTTSILDFNEIKRETTHADVEFNPDHLARSIETWNAMNQHRWASNNSVFGKVGMDYSGIAAQTAVNGEPGYVWLDNMRDYGRFVDGLHPGIDGRVMGTNPCGEQSLESYELCNLVETFPAFHDDSDDYLRTLKFAYLYAKTVTLLPTHNVRSNSVTLRNRRIGLSQSGIIQAFQKFGRRKILQDFCDAGYHEVARWDKIYSGWLCVPESIKKTSVKPSGTLSLVVGVPPGIHYPEVKTYWRHVRLARDSVLVELLTDAGYHVEPCLNDPNRTVIARFAVDESYLPSVEDVTIWEQLENVADYQRYWADNQPSCTVKFKRTEAPAIKRALEVFEDRLKVVSFLPFDDHHFHQAPIVACTPEEVAEYNKSVHPIDFDRWTEDAVGSKFCDGDKCTFDLTKK